MNNKFIKSLMLSMISVILLVTATFVSTFVLYSDTTEVNNHIVAGSVEVGFKRTCYEGTPSLKDGTLGDYTIIDDTALDLKDDSSKIFNIKNAMPSLTHKAVLEVSNEDSIAFVYTVRLINLTAEAENDKALANQILIEISNGEQSIQFMLADYEKPENVITLGTIYAGAEAQTFTISATFLNSEYNNLAKYGKVSFDIQLLAVQQNPLDK